MTGNEIPGNGEFARALLLQQLEDLLKQGNETNRLAQTTAADVAVIKEKLTLLPCDSHRTLLSQIESNKFATKDELMKVDQKVNRTVNWRAFLAHTLGTVVTVAGLGFAFLQLLNQP